MQEVILGLLQYTSDTDTIRISIDGCDNYEFGIDGFEYIFAKKRRKKDIEHGNQEIKNLIPHDASSIDNNSITYIIGGDALSPAISAASVVAKVTRDRMMCDFHEDFPEYGFASHKGYGTRKHREAMIHYGITPLHRKSYAPVKSLILGETSI